MKYRLSCLIFGIAALTLCCGALFVAATPTDRMPPDPAPPYTMVVLAILGLLVIGLARWSTSRPDGLPNPARSAQKRTKAHKYTASRRRPAPALPAAAQPDPAPPSLQHSGSRRYRWIRTLQRHGIGPELQPLQPHELERRLN